MTVKEIQEKIEALRLSMQAACQAFETETGCHIHSVPVDRNEKDKSIGIRVKVQIPG